MEFDKSRVYTALNADELKPGDKVIVAGNIGTLKWALNYEKIESLYNEIVEIKDENHPVRFVVKAVGHDSKTTDYALAYLVERAENCTNCEYEGSAGCSVVEICGENKLTHRCHMYKAKDTKKNLCNSCKRSFAECPATANDIIFGDGVGNDNVYECDKYEQKSTARCINCEYYSTYEGYCNKHIKPTRYDNTNCKYYNKVNDYEQKAETPELISLGNGQYAERKHCRPFKDTDELIKAWIAKRMVTYPDLCLPHIWVRQKECSKGGLLITYFGEDEVKTDMGFMTMNKLLSDYTFTDGSPCGVEE